MLTIDRRTFLSGLAGSFLVASADRLQGSQQYPQIARAPAATEKSEACWLDVAAPFVVVDPAQQLYHPTAIDRYLLPRSEGFRDQHYATEYQVLLFDAAGKEIKLDNAGKLEIPAMRPTLLDMRAMAKRDAFFGGPRSAWRLLPTRYRARATCSARASCAGTCPGISTTCMPIRRRRNKWSAISTTPCRSRRSPNTIAPSPCSTPTSRNPTARSAWWTAWEGRRAKAYRLVPHQTRLYSMAGPEGRRNPPARRWRLLPSASLNWPMAAWWWCITRAKRSPSHTP